MIPYQDESEFKRLLEGLASDVVDAHIHYKLYKDLHDAIEEFPNVVAQSNTFWTNTLKSHWNTSLNMLTRAYDQEPNALHLESFLKTIKSNTDLFSDDNFRERKKDNPYLESLANESRTPDLATVDADILLCSKNDPLVKTLIIYRGNAIAHRSAKNTAQGKIISDKYPMSWADFEVLLKRAIVILNKYSQLFEASSYSTGQIGADDFRYIFECVNEAIKQSQSKQRDFKK